MRITVYKVSFPNGKVYIGITSKSFERRKIQHISSAKKGSTYKFHKALQKYSDQESWEIVSIEDIWESARKLEMKLILKYDSFKKGYNSTTGGEGTPGRKFSNEQRIELARRRGTAKSVFVFDLVGNFIREFGSEVECVIYFESRGKFLDIRNIDSCLRNKKRCCYGLFFSFEKKFLLKERGTKGLNLIILHKNGKEEFIKGICNAAKSLKVSVPTISDRLSSGLPLKSGERIRYAS